MKRFLLLFPLTAHAYLGAFDPQYREPEPVRIAVVQSEFPAAECYSAVACVKDGVVYLPARGSVGELYGVVGAAASADAVAGHELRHVFEGEFHPPLLPFVELRK